LHRGMGGVTMKPLRTHCIHGHELTPDNVWVGEQVRRTKDGREYRSEGRHCNTCISNRKRLRYHSDPAFRARANAYCHWWRCGDPEGRTWSEIKAEIAS